MDILNERSHLAHLGLNELRKQRQLCDVIIVVNKKKVHAHRCVLAVNSAYFLAMFTANLDETEQKEVELKETDPDAVEELIDFFYSGKLSVTFGNVQNLLTVAVLLQLDDVIKACCEYVVGFLCAKNCLGIRRFADMHSLADLVKATDGYIKRHFEDIIIEDEFLELDVGSLVELLSSDKLEIYTEETVYKAGVSWLTHEKQGRTQHVDKVVPCVRFCLLDPTFLVNVVCKEPVISNSKACRQLVDRAKNYQLLSRQQVGNNPPAKPRRGQGIPVVFAIGGLNEVEDAGATEPTIEVYDVRTYQWSGMPSMEKGRHGCGVVASGKVLHIIGGVCGLHAFGSGAFGDYEKYDQSGNELLSHVCRNVSKRLQPGVALADGLLYVVGGLDESETIMTTLQRYNSSANIVENLPSMIITKYLMGVGILDGLLFTCGGLSGLGGTSTNSVECYVIQSRMWNSVAALNENRSNCSCRATKGNLYVLGGLDRNDNILATCERYDLLTRTWSFIAPMKAARNRPGVTEWNGLIYAVAGSDVDGRLLRSAEVYTPGQDEWNACPHVKNQLDAVIRYQAACSSAF